MLIRLSVANYALIDQLELQLSPALNIITGETGAGKSILMGALGLIMGGRADTAALKDDQRNCVVEGVFDVSGYDLTAFFGDNDLEYEPQTVIRRVITPAGKSRAYVNDMPVQLSTLKELSARLIDIHSQHQSLMVANEAFRMNIIDSVAGDKAVLARYRELYSSYRAAERELARLRDEAGQNRRDEDYLRHQHDQIAVLRLKEGEQEELEAEQRELANAELIQGALGESEAALEEDETGVLPKLKHIEHTLRNISAAYPRAEEFSGRIHSAFVELKDIVSEVSSEAGRIEVNPARLSEVDNRLNAIYTLLQKHHLDTADQLIALAKELAARLEVISNSDEAIAALEARVGETLAAATVEAAKITTARTKAAGKLSQEVEKMLDRLGMPASRFVCDISPAQALTPDGADEVRFLFSANKNMAPQPMEKIASGGEISRVMLTLKSLVARYTMLPTIIFDEIDTGVSGRIADAMGEIIVELAANMQVLNITHLPQVASKGETHFLVYKNDTPSGTQSHIRLLTPEERVTEIAKMLSGSTITDAAIAQAETLLGK